MNYPQYSNYIISNQTIQYQYYRDCISTINVDRKHLQILNTNVMN